MYWGSPWYGLYSAQASSTWRHSLLTGCMHLCQPLTNQVIRVRHRRRRLRRICNKQERSLSRKMVRWAGQQLKTTFKTDETGDGVSHASLPPPLATRSQQNRAWRSTRLSRPKVSKARSVKLQQKIVMYWLCIVCKKKGLPAKREWLHFPARDSRLFYCMDHQWTTNYTYLSTGWGRIRCLARRQQGHHLQQEPYTLRWENRQGLLEFQLCRTWKVWGASVGRFCAEPSTSGENCWYGSLSVYNPIPWCTGDQSEHGLLERSNKPLRCSGSNRQSTRHQKALLQLITKRTNIFKQALIRLYLADH